MHYLAIETLCFYYYSSNTVAFKQSHPSDLLMSLPILAIYDTAVVQLFKSCLHIQSQRAISSTYYRGLTDQESLKGSRLSSLTSV